MASMRATEKAAFFWMVLRSLRGILPRLAQASQAATSTRNQDSYFICSDQTDPMAGRVYRAITKGSWKKSFTRRSRRNRIFLIHGKDRSGTPDIHEKPLERMGEEREKTGENMDSIGNFSPSTNKKGR